MGSSGIAIGIDLGTTYSCVGVWQHDHVEIIANEQGNRTTPSCVSFLDRGRLIGDAANAQAAINPYNTVFDVKRLIGRRFEDPTVQADISHFPFEVFNKEGKPYIRVEYHGQSKEFSPEEITSMVLLKMKKIAETYLGKTVHDAVITVPAYFNDSQRQATMDAAAISGINVLRFINEATAAAIAYGLETKLADECNVVVIDLGGGTFDVSLLAIEEGVFEVKATGGDSHLGGEDFVDRLVNHFAEEFKLKHKKDPFSNSRAIRRLHTACERAKRSLSFSYKTSIEVDSFFEGIDFFSSITRARFEELCQDLFARVLETIQSVLHDAKTEKTDVNEIILVGGSSRIPRVVELISGFFGGKEPNKSINPEEAVSYGATVQAAILSGSDTSGKTSEILLIDVAPISLGIKTMGGGISTFVKRNTSIPTKKSQTFSTHRNNQRGARIQVYEGEHARARDNNLLGTLELSRILPDLRGVPRIEVTFDIDANGVLSVYALDKTTRRSNVLTVTNGKGRFSKLEMDRMIKDAEGYMVEDEATAARNDLESYSFSLRSSINDKRLAHKFDPLDKTKLDNAIKDIISWFDASEKVSKKEYDEKEKALKAIAVPIMQKIDGAEGTRAGFGHSSADAGDDPASDSPDTASDDDLGVEEVRDGEHKFQD